LTAVFGGFISTVRRKKTAYKERNLIERLFQKLKHFRPVATRYERLARNYLAMVFLASALIWLV